MQITKDNIKLFQDCKSVSFSQVGLNSPADGTSSGKIKLNFEDKIRGQIVDSSVILDNVSSWSNDHDKQNVRISQMVFDNFASNYLYDDSTARTAFNSLKIGDDIRLNWEANYNTGLDLLTLRVYRGKKTFTFHLDHRMTGNGSKMIKWEKLPDPVIVD